MNKLAEIEIKLEAARQHIAITTTVRDELQSRYAHQEDPTTKDILAVHILELTTQIHEQQKEIDEVDVMLQELKDRFKHLL